jgi:hypothetical protein
MKRWKKFEQIVATIHRLLNADYDIEEDSMIVEPNGAKHQIDVVLRPRTPFLRPVLVSCKAWSKPVEIDHFREWSDIVQHSGAAAGVIVAESGFTSDSIKAAQNVERRVSLWKPRPLTKADFAPDNKSPNGYIARVLTHLTLATSRLVEGSITLDISRADGPPLGETVAKHFSAATRNLWYLRDEQDNVVENLWDLFVKHGQSANTPLVELIPRESRFLMLDGVRMRFNRLTFEIQHNVHEVSFEVNLLEETLAYENVLTGSIQIVPLPPSVLLGSDDTV